MSVNGYVDLILFRAPRTPAFADQEPETFCEARWRDGGRNGGKEGGGMEGGRRNEGSS